MHGTKAGVIRARAIALVLTAACATTPSQMRHARGGRSRTVARTVL